MTLIVVINTFHSLVICVACEMYFKYKVLNCSRKIKKMDILLGNKQVCLRSTIP